MLFVRNKKGSAGTEFAVLVGLVGVLAVGGVSAIATSTTTSFERTDATFTSATLAAANVDAEAGSGSGSTLIELHGVGSGCFGETDIGTINSVSGGDADETFFGVANAVNNIAGNNGNDDITGGPHGDLLLGGRGFDNVQGGCGPDTLYGGRDDDTIYAGPGDDLIGGDFGADTLAGEGGSDTFRFVGTHLGDGAVTTILDYTVEDSLLFRNVVQSDMLFYASGANVVLSYAGVDEVVFLNTTLAVVEDTSRIVYE